jgi:hypothetical protein
MGGGSRTSPPFETGEAAFETGETAFETGEPARDTGFRMSAATLPAPALRPPAPDLFRLPKRAPLVTLVSAGDGLRAALMETRHRRRRWDVIVADRVLVLCRVRGIDPVLAGAFIGFLLLPIIGAVPGALVGRRIARKRAGRRYVEYCRTPVSALRLDPRHRSLPVAEIHTAVLTERGARRRLTVERVDGSRDRYTWDVRTARNDAASWALPFALGRAFRLARPPRRG